MAFYLYHHRGKNRNFPLRIQEIGVQDQKSKTLLEQQDHWDFLHTLRNGSYQHIIEVAVRQTQGSKFILALGTLVRLGGQFLVYFRRHDRQDGRKHCHLPASFKAKNKNSHDSYCIRNACHDQTLFSVQGVRLFLKRSHFVPILHCKVYKNYFRQYVSSNYFNNSM